jgi:hypothetical protein
MTSCQCGAEMCLFSALDALYALLQPSTLHTNSFSSVWVRMWSISPSARANGFLQPSTPQTNGFTTVETACIFLARLIACIARRSLQIAGQLASKQCGSSCVFLANLIA